MPKDAFWKWYRSQSAYQTKEDRAACMDIYKSTISMPEMARALGVSRSTVYSLLNSSNYAHYFEVIIVADQKRITKKSFLKFLEGQKEYRLDPQQDYGELSKEGHEDLADFRRKKLWQTGNQRSNGNRKYLTPEEAAFLAHVSRTTMAKWYQEERFPVVYLGNRVYIKRREFEEWLKIRGRSK